MSLFINQRITEQLLQEPESGMGWQVVEVQRLYLHSFVLIINAQEAVERAGKISLVKGGADPHWIRAELEDPSTEFRIAVLPANDQRAWNLIGAKDVRAGGGPASDEPVVQSNEAERFLRFSAFENDLRILEDGSVRSGTYVTTHLDGITHVRTGMDAVRRYALPNPDPAVNRFYLRPEADPHPPWNDATGERPAWRWRRGYL